MDYILPTKIVKTGIVFDVSVCLCVCQQTNKWSLVLDSGDIL